MKSKPETEPLGAASCSPFYGRAIKGGKNMPRGHTVRCACGWRWTHANDNKTKSKAVAAYNAHVREANAPAMASADNQTPPKEMTL